MNHKHISAPYEAPQLDVEAFEVETGFAVSSGDDYLSGEPEDWKDGGYSWEQD